MTQQEAIQHLTQLLGRAPVSHDTCTGLTETCKIDECMLCSVRDCPDHEPLHYHHDGCPACFLAGRTV